MRRMFGAGLAALALASSASAAPIVFTNRVTFESQLSSSAIETFDTVSPGALSVGANVLGSLTFTIDGNRGGQSGGTVAAFGTGNQFEGYVDPGLDFGSSFIRIDMPFAVTAFGGDFLTTTSGDALTLMVGPDLIKFGSYLGYGLGNGFLGFTSTTPFTFITFSTEGISPGIAGEFFDLDNATYGAAVPEPATLLLICSGLLGLGLTRRRRRN